MVVLIRVAMLTVVLSWTVLNMVFTVRYADQHRGSGAPAPTSATRTQRNPRYRDFASLAFANRHVYQVSDTRSRKSADSPHGALPSLARTFRRGDCRRLGQSHRLPDRSIPCGAQGCGIRRPGRFLAECEYVGFDTGCDEDDLEGAVVN